VQPQVKKEEPKAKPKPAPSQVNNLSMEAQKELKALRKKMDGIENEILETEVKIEEAEKELASPEVFESPDALAQSNEKYQLIKAELEKLNDQWEETGMKIEDLEKQLT
jgi:ATP-binding cassette, subfamily F, member 3